MKKTLVSISLALMAMCGFSAVAQQQDTNAPKEKTEKCCKNNQRCEKGKSECPRFNAFEGITLSADQQSKIDALKQARKEGRCKMNEAKNKAARPDRKERAAEHRQAKREYLTQVKEILTPDQYVVFLENIAINAPAKHGGKMKMEQGRRGDRCGKMKSNGERMRPNQGNMKGVAVNRASVN